MKLTRLQRAVLVGLAAGALAWLLHKSGLALPLVAGVGLFVFVLAQIPWFGVRALDRLILMLRTFHWRGEQGHHHSFGGVPLAVHDDGRHCWVAGEGLQRVLGTQDAEDVLAARHTGRWRRDAKGTLMLRVDAVVSNLATGPGRMDPRTVRLRRYLEQVVLFPAAERRRRSETIQ